MVLDSLTPLDLEEVENYLFYSYSVDLNFLPQRFKDAVYDYIQSVGEIMRDPPTKELLHLANTKLSTYLAVFNAKELHRYHAPVVGEIRLTGKLWAELDQWRMCIQADYWGLSMDATEHWPKALVQQVYDKWLPGYKDLRNQEHVANIGKALENMIYQTIKPYVGMPLKPANINSLASAIARDLQTTGLIDQVSLEFGANNPKIFYVDCLISPSPSVTQKHRITVNLDA